MFIEKICSLRSWTHIKNIALNFSLFKFFFPFLLSIYNMVNSMDIYKSLNNSFGAVMKNPEILKFAPDLLKTKKCVSMKLKNYLVH